MTDNELLQLILEWQQHSYRLQFAFMAVIIVALGYIGGNQR